MGSGGGGGAGVMSGGEASDHTARLEAEVAALAMTLRSSDCGTLAEAVVERVGGRTVGYGELGNGSRS